MSSISLLLKRKITGAPRAIIHRAKKLLRAMLAKLWKIVWALIFSPLYAVAVHAETRTARLAFAESILLLLDRAPVYLEFHARRLAQVQIARGKLREPAGILMRIARLNPTASTVRAANHAWSELAQTDLGWHAAVGLQRPQRTSQSAVVISETGEDLFGDLFEQLRLSNRNFSLKYEDPEPVVAECVLDRVVTDIARQLESAPLAVVAAPTSLTDYGSLAVAKALADWAEAAFIVRLPITEGRPDSTESAQRAYAQFSSFIANAQVVTADSQLMKQLALLTGGNA